MSQVVAATPNSSKGRDAWLVPLALLSLYLIWGSTYLGIHWAVAGEGFETFQLNSIRFILSGSLLFAFLKMRGQPTPNSTQIKNAAIVGLFLIIGGNGLTTLSIKLGAPSGLSATVIATTPLWAALWSGLWGKRSSKQEWLGMAIGILGVAVLTLDGSFKAHPAIFIQFIAPMLWSFGSIWSRNKNMPKPMMASSIEMFAGGIACLLISATMREPWRMPQASNWNAFWYLVIVGSLVGFNAYIYLLEKVRPALATSYAYVNPAVALALGSLLNHEIIGSKTIIALPIILIGVGIIAFAQNTEMNMNKDFRPADAQAET